MLTKTRMLAYHLPCDTIGGTFLDYDKLMEERFTFMASVKTRVEKDYYHIHDLTSTPSLRVSLCLSFVGTGSLNTTAILNCRDSGRVFTNTVHQIVAVDMATRKSTALPDWWKKKHAGAIIGNEKVIVQRVEVPAESYSYELKVPWSDIDQYGHVTYVAYIRYCFDCAVDGIVNGAFPAFKGSARLGRVSDIQMSFGSECFANDILHIATWQDADHPSTLRFDMKLRGETIFQSSITFYQTTEV